MRWNGKCHSYLCSGKINAVAILRCLGAQGKQAFLIYLVQIVAIGFIGSVIGAAIGSLLQQFLPIIIKDLLPLAITTEISWPSIAQGIILGIVISFLFALLPLISIRNVSPLNTLRITFQPVPLFKDPLKWAVYITILLFVFGFSLLQLKNWQQATFFFSRCYSRFPGLGQHCCNPDMGSAAFFPVFMELLMASGVGKFIQAK